MDIFEVGVYNSRKDINDDVIVLRASWENSILAKNAEQAARAVVNTMNAIGQLENYTEVQCIVYSPCPLGYGDETENMKIIVKPTHVYHVHFRH